MNKILIGASLSVAAIAGYLLLHRPPVTSYYTASIDRGDINATVTTSGTLNAVTTVQVGSQVSGNIIALYADFNTKVKKGQLVAEIDPAPFQAAVDQATATLNAAKAAVVTAQATLAKSKSDLAGSEATVASQKANEAKARSAVELARVENDRRQAMVKTGSTSQEDADTAKANYDQALSAVDAAAAAVTAADAEAESARMAVSVSENQLRQSEAVVQQDDAILAQARLNLNHTRILAPVDGTVESRNMDVGQTVAASFQAPTIFLIAQDLTKMQVDTNVDEADVGRIRLAQAATFTVDAWPGQTFRGAVSQIRQAPINVQNVVTYDIVVEVSNADLKLFPGMTANVTIATARAANVLRLPKAALRFRPRGNTAETGRSGKGASTAQTVYVLNEKGEPEPMRITTGISDANYVEVVSGGLNDGQKVITGSAGPANPAAPTPPGSQTSGRKMGI